MDCVAFLPMSGPRRGPRRYRNRNDEFWSFRETGANVMFCRVQPTGLPGYVGHVFEDGGPASAIFTPQDLVYTRRGRHRLEALRTTTS
jgi:hypothetical protein